MENNTNLILRQDVLALGKVELQTYGKEEAERLIEEGWADPTKLLVDSKKYLELLTAFNKAMKAAAVSELEGSNGKAEIGNAKISLGNTGDRLDYAADPIYVELKSKLDARVALLKLAKKQQDSLYDNMGIEVPKVPVKTFGEIVPKITL